MNDHQTPLHENVGAISIATEAIEVKYIDRVKNIFTQLPDSSSEIEWFIANFHEVPEQIHIENFEIVRTEYDEGKRAYPHTLHVYTNDAIFHFQHFTSGYIGGGVQAFRKLLMSVSVDLTDDFLAKYASFHVDLLEKTVTANDRVFDLDYRVRNKTIMEIVMNHTIKVGYETLMDYLRMEVEGVIHDREVFEKGVAIARKKKGGN